MKYVFLTKGRSSINIGPENGVFPIGYINRDITKTDMIDDMLESILRLVLDAKDKITMLCVYTPADINDMQSVSGLATETIEFLDTQITKYNTLALAKLLMQAGYKIQCRELNKEEQNGTIRKEVKREPSNSTHEPSKGV
jgi:hypothetical protein